MDEYKQKKTPITYAGGDGPIDVVNFVPPLDLKGFREKNVEIAISDPASQQRYMIQFQKQIKGSHEISAIDGYR